MVTYNQYFRCYSEIFILQILLLTDVTQIEVGANKLVINFEIPTVKFVWFVR